MANVDINVVRSRAVLAGLFKGPYDLERCVCDLERLDRPTKAGWDGISGIR